MTEPTPLPEPTGENVEQEYLTDRQVMQMNMSGAGRAVSSALLTMGVLTGLFGLIMLFWPRATVQVVAVLFGIWLVFSGLVMLAQAIGSGAPGLMRVLLGLGGALSLIVGGVCVFNADASVTILVIFVLIGWLAHGLAYVLVGIRDKYSPNRRAFLVFGGLQIVLALLVIAWPQATISILVRLIGVGLLLTAVLQIWIARRIRSASQESSVIVVD